MNFTAGRSLVLTVTRQGLVDGTIAALRQQITNRAWPVGSRIPVESELAAQLSVSRNTLREAVRALVHAGLLETRQGSGTFVRASHEIEGVLGRLLADQDLRDVLETRRGLEVEAAGLAAVRRSPRLLARMSAARDRVLAANAAGDVDALLDADLDLHLAIVEAAGNAVLLGLYRGLADRVRESVRTAMSRLAERSRADGHRVLLDAIRRGDPAAARRAAAAHLDAMIATLAEAGEVRSAPGGPAGGRVH
jgi:DNA-binding FadR family transcriptional regulator